MTTTKTLPKGKYIQIYRGAMNGQQHDNIGAKLDEFKALGIVGIAWHGFTTEMGPITFTELTKLCTDRGLLSIAAFGMGSKDPVGMATRIGHVALVPGCTAVMLDMEGAWDEGKQQAAVDLGKTLKSVAPDALIVDQPWPEPLWHSQYPWEETSAFVDIRAPQEYYNDWKPQYGTSRYKNLVPIFAAQWAKLETTRLAPKGLVKPKIKTIQGYVWDDIFSDLVNCLTSNDTLIIWAEPFPTDSFMKGLAVVKKLGDLGFVGPNAVKDFQTSTNGKLKADNICGPLTQKELGF